MGVFRRWRSVSRPARWWAAALVTTLTGSTVTHAEWPQWRGPHRDGTVSDSASTGPWLVEPRLVWEREVGEGYSGPIVADERVWVHARRGGQEVVTCLTLAEGQPRWSQGYEAAFEQDPTALAHGEGPYATPSFADGRLFTFGVTGVLSAWDAATGDLQWRTDYAEERFPRYPLFGMAASPLVWNDMVFVHFGGTEGRRFGAPGRGAMVAMRVSDGQERWRWTGDGPAMAASPVPGSIGEQSQLVFKSQEWLVGVDAHTGRELWRHPYEVAEDNTIGTPLILGDRLVTSDYQKGITAWRIGSDGDAWTLRQLWHVPTVSLSLSSPVVVGDQVVSYSHTRRGHLVGLDLANGELLWRGETRWGPYVNVSLINWDGELVVLRDTGLLVVGEVSRDGFRIGRTYRLGRETTWAHPAVVDDRIVIRDGDRLAVYRLRGAGSPPARGSH